MGDVIEFNPDYFSDLEMLIRRYRELVAKYGEPMRLYVPNEKRMDEMNRAASYIRQMIEQCHGDVDVEIGLDEDVRDMGFIDMRTAYLPLGKDEIELLHRAEELADALDVCVTDDERISYELAFHNVMTLKNPKK